VLAILTFVVKEGFRDHFKDLATTVDSAESLFIITDSLSVAPDFAAQLSNLSKTTPGTAFDEANRMMNSQQRYIKASLDTTKRLLVRLPYQQSKVKELEDFEARFMREVIDSNAIYIEESGAWIRESHGKNNKEKFREATELGKHYAKLVAMSAEVRDYAKDALKIAEKMKNDAEFYYDTSTRALYIIFPLALLLAVVGEIYEVKTVEFE
jgi:hypothetical protein